MADTQLQDGKLQVNQYQVCKHQVCKQQVCKQQGAVRTLVLCLSLAVMLAIVAWPPLLTASPAGFSHNAAMLLMLGMSCGFVYGIGFVPRLRLWRWLFSAPVALGLMFIGVALALF